MAPGVGTGTDDESSRTFRYSVQDGDRPVLVVLEAVSRVTGVDVDDLDPLANVVDTDALNDLFAEPIASTDFNRSSGRPRPAGPLLSFEYQGVHVTVAADRVTVERA